MYTLRNTVVRLSFEERLQVLGIVPASRSDSHLKCCAEGPGGQFVALARELDYSRMRTIAYNWGAKMSPRLALGVVQWK